MLYKVEIKGHIMDKDEVGPPEGTVLIMSNQGTFFAEMTRVDESEPNEVQWYKPELCPITPKQFNAIFDDEEDEQ